MGKAKEYLPFISISQENTLSNKTGSWRTQKPICERGISPCMANCLSGQDIPHWIAAIREGELEKAYRIITQANPFPSLTGRICPRPCENECNRKNLGGAVAINSLEEFVGDWGLKNVAETFPEITKKEKVAVIGSGPAGLSCAYYLRKMGYQLTIFEALPVIGGLMAYGIPEFRLPKKFLKQELEKKILVLGIAVKTTAHISKTAFEILLAEFDAVFVAAGLSKSKKIDLPGFYSFGVLNGLDLLKNINLGFAPRLGEKVVVIGGGNTAIDVARSLKRFGSGVSIFYRRSKSEMPALKEEVLAAEKEGIKIEELITPVKIIAKDGGRVDLLECQKMELGEPDESSRKKPIPIEGSNFSVKVDAVIFAVGEEKESDFLPENWQSNKKIFIGGDFENQAGTVAAAVKSGRENAEAVDGFLRGETIPPDHPKKEIIRYEKDWLKQYFPFQLRTRGFGKFAPEFLARYEAGRCLSCGLCNLCGKCFDFCPDVAISKENWKIEINYDYCKGCGICIQECPTKSIVFERDEPSSAEDREGEGGIK